MLSEENNGINKVLTSASIILVGIFVSKILGFVYRLLVARIGPEQYGLIAIALAVITLLANLSLLGLGQGVLRYVAIYSGRKDYPKVKGTIISALKLSFILSVIISLLLFVFSEYISITVFKNIQLKNVLRIFSLVIPFLVMRDIILNALKALQKIKYEIYAKNITESIVKVILTIIFLYLGINLLGAALAFSIAILISFIFSLYYLQKNGFQIFSKLSPISDNRELINYSWPLLINSYIFQLILWIDTIMLGYFTNAVEVGIYNTALPTAQLLFIIPYAFTALLLPVLIELKVLGKDKEFENTYRTIAKWIFLANGLIFTLFFVYSKEIISVLFGAEYLSASNVLIILSAGYLISYVTLTSTSMLMIIKKTNIILKISLIGMAGSIILNLILIPIYGIIGAAIATSLSYTMMGLLTISYAYRFTKINPLSSKFFNISLSIILSVIIINHLKLIEANIYLSLLFGSILLVIIYLLLLILTRSFESQEKTLLLSLRKKITK